MQRNLKHFNVFHALSKCPQMSEEVPSPIQLPITICQRKVSPRARANATRMFMERFISSRGLHFIQP
jgi:hypothetical protein